MWRSQPTESTVWWCRPRRSPRPRLTTLIQHLQEEHVHVHIATGITGISAGRLRSLPMSYEPMLYVEAGDALEGAGDSEAGLRHHLVVGCAGGGRARVLVAAIAIKLGDRGPVFFRQTRVGATATTFGCSSSARCASTPKHARLDAAPTNERNGPLFKMASDPRVTTIGRFLREHQPRRAAAAVQRAARRDEPRRAPPGAAAGGRQRSRSDLRQRELVPPGHHRPVAGRGPRQPLVRGLPPTRPLLRRELVDHPRPR